MRKGKWIGTRIGYAHKGAWEWSNTEQRLRIKIRLKFGPCLVRLSDLAEL